MTNEMSNSFEYIHLNDIDPNFAPIETGVYSLQLKELKRRVYFYKADHPSVIAGDVAEGEVKGDRITSRCVITDHPELSGRQVWNTLWPNQSTFKALRRLADATGIIQDDEEGFDAWLQRVEEEAPRFKCLVRNKQKGNDIETSVDFFQVQPADED